MNNRRSEQESRISKISISCFSHIVKKDMFLHLISILLSFAGGSVVTKIFYPNISSNSISMLYYSVIFAFLVLADLQCFYIPVIVANIKSFRLGKPILATVMKIGERPIHIGYSVCYSVFCLSSEKEFCYIKIYVDPVGKDALHVGDKILFVTEKTPNFYWRISHRIKFAPLRTYSCVFRELARHELSNLGQGAVNFELDGHVTEPKIISFSEFQEA